MKNIEEFSGKSLEEMTSAAGRKRSGRKGKRTRQKNKRGDSKVESNDSPEIPDRGETSDIPGLPSGAQNRAKQRNITCPSCNIIGDYKMAFAIHCLVTYQVYI